jgi:predicted phage-related endonuclease
MTINEYHALTTLEEKIRECEHFNEEIKTCIRYSRKENYIKFIKDFDVALQKEVLIALQSAYENRIQKLHDEFNRLLKR